MFLVDTELVDSKEATCTEPGYEEYYGVLSFEGQDYVWDKTVEIDPLGHEWKDVTYVWADDNLSVIASAVCGRDASHTAEKTVETSYEVITAPTCEDAGVGRYTAVFSDEPFETQIRDVEIDPAGHAYGEAAYEWSEDNASVTATIVCTKDESHVVTETVEASYEVIVEPTYEEEGLGRFTATFENELFETQTRDVAIPKQEAPQVHLVAPPLVAIYNSANGADIRFDAVEGATEYIIMQKYNGVWSEIKTVKAEDVPKAGSHLKLIDESVKTSYGKGFIYSVAVRDYDGTLLYSKKGLALYRLQQPTIKTIKSSSKGSVTLTWGKVDAHGYEVQYSSDNGKTWTKVPETKNTTLTVTGLKSGTTYVFRIRCQKTNKDRGTTWSEYSKWSSVTVK